MLMRKLQSPRVAVPVGMALTVCGLSLNSISLLVGRMAHPLLHSSPEMNDFFRGFLIGIGIALEIGGIVVMLLSMCAGKKRGEAPSRSPGA